MPFEKDRRLNKTCYILRKTWYSKKDHVWWKEDKEIVFIEI